MKLKCVFLSLLFAISLGTESVVAQGPRNAVSFDVFLPLMVPVSILSGEEMVFLPLNVKYQRVLADHLVLMLKSGLNFNWGNNEKSLDVYPLVGLEWHPFRTGLEGFYVGLSGFFNYSACYYDTEVTEGTDHNYRIAIGPTFGWQFVRRSKMVIDLTFGLGYGYDNEVDVNRKKTSGFSVDETIGGVFVGFGF